MIRFKNKVEIILTKKLKIKNMKTNMKKKRKWNEVLVIVKVVIIEKKNIKE